MALNKKYFDAIQLDLGERRYYNSEKVNAILNDIRKQALTLSAENEVLRQKLGISDGLKVEIEEPVPSVTAAPSETTNRVSEQASKIIRDAERSAKAAYQETVDKANERAAQIIAEAENSAKAAYQETIDKANERASQIIAEAENSAKAACQEMIDKADEEASQIVAEAADSAEVAYREAIAKANEQAAQIIADAESRSAAILEDSVPSQEYTVQRVQDSFARLRQRQQDCIDAINAEWQSFLCGLLPEDAPEQDPVSGELSRKVGAIADELFSIGVNEADNEPVKL